VTPDSFSDGGQWQDQDAAVRHAIEMAEQGADLIDVGGESTRPGSQRVAAEQQKTRVVGVIERVRRELDRRFGPATVAVSIDTTLAAVAAAALDAGANMLNDVSAGRDDQGMLDLAASRGAPIVLMHMIGTPATMGRSPQYEDVVGEVESFLLDRARAAIAAGVPRQQIVIDPGIGFGKTTEHNLVLLANLGRLVATGYPVLLGASRKRFMSELGKDRNGKTPDPTQRLGATCATTAVGVGAGVALFRVHDVPANRQAADLACKIRRSSPIHPTDAEQP
jgi:dihydropteroate synthase